MTKGILQQLTTQPWVQHRYVLSDIDGRTFVNGPHTYGVLMLIDRSLNLRQLLSFPFHTQQGRQLLLAQIQLRTEILLVGNVHLESTRGEANVRSHQLQTCQSVFDRYARNRPDVTCLLMGDFNFHAKWSENTRQMNILRNWIDLWPSLNGVHNSGNTFKKCRYDRIMFRSTRVHPIGIQIIGNRPIGQSSNNIYPSDHFGLMADFNLPYV